MLREKDITTSHKSIKEMENMLEDEWIVPDSESLERPCLQTDAPSSSVSLDLEVVVTKTPKRQTTQKHNRAGQSK